MMVASTVCYERVVLSNGEKEHAAYVQPSFYYLFGRRQLFTPAIGGSRIGTPAPEIAIASSPLRRHAGVSRWKMVIRLVRSGSNLAQHLGGGAKIDRNIVVLIDAGHGGPY